MQSHVWTCCLFITFAHPAPRDERNYSLAKGSKFGVFILSGLFMISFVIGILLYFVLMNMCGFNSTQLCGNWHGCCFRQCTR